MARLGEFAIIDQRLKPLAESDAALGLADDAALFTPSPGGQTVLSTDMLIEGVHYLPDDPPGDIAAKALRVNLSDLAAMGAAPTAYLMGLALSDTQDEAWITDFVAGLAGDQAVFGVSLTGGDITAAPGPMTISITAIGEVPTGTALRRNGARPGDSILVSGTIGDAALGLRILQERLTAEDDDRAFLIDRYRRPSPRLALGTALRGVATAAIDVSDGLAADMAHIAAQSGVKAVIEAETVPLSAAARKILDNGGAALSNLIAGGDDYELLLTVPPDNVAAAMEKAGDLHIPLTRIGHIAAGQGMAVVDSAGNDIALPRAGYTHF